MSYEPWRISFQSSEQATQAAYTALQQAQEERDALAAHVERIISEWNAGEDIFSDEWISRMGDIVEDAPITSLAHRDAQQQRSGIINACNHVLSMNSDTHKAFFATDRYVYVSTRALREYADTLTEQAEATPCPPR